MGHKRWLVLNPSVIAAKMWSAVAPSVRKHIERAQYETWVNAWIDRVDNDEWAQTGLDALALPGTQLEHYRERALQVGEHHFVVGIRFLAAKVVCPSST